MNSRSEFMTSQQSSSQPTLMGELDRVAQLLQWYVQHDGTKPQRQPPAVSTVSPLHAEHQSPLWQLRQIFNLSDFEQDVLLLCAGVELDPSFRALCAQAQPEMKHGSPTFSLAGLILENCHWIAFTPEAPLRRSQLIEVGSGNTLMTAPLRIDERILHYLMGIFQVDNRLSGSVRATNCPDFLVDSHQSVSDEIRTIWRHSQASECPIVQLCGAEAASKQAIAAAACRDLKVSLYTLSSNAIPLNSQDLHQLLRLWEREASLSGSALLLNLDTTHEPEAARESAIALLIESMAGLLFISNRDRYPLHSRTVITFDINTPTTPEQIALWQNALSNSVVYSDSDIKSLVAQFNLSPNVIQAVSMQAIGSRDGSAPIEPSHAASNASIHDRLWEICRVQARPQLDELAQRIDTTESWEDLILPKSQKDVLEEIEGQVRHRARVYEQWGFAGKGGRGLGISALFSGLSGTGKTMAAGVLAQKLHLDLYRIDLSSVVSKYIGETEKNLRRVFDAAEVGGVILLFDEADALFGKRSDVKDSHDRYANMEVSYLLQRMEAYRGLAILTTNLKDAIDPAFMRRIRFVVRFPFPEYGDRIKIWQRIFPANTPTKALNYEALAKLNIAGGNIRNIAMNAAFRAAGDKQDQFVTMEHLLKAAQSEYLKLERSMTEAELKGWPKATEAHQQTS